MRLRIRTKPFTAKGEAISIRLDVYTTTVIERIIPINYRISITDYERSMQHESINMGTLEWT
ncbi:hypothetical protein J23TS9_34280 [Paenibacillus sp. J23TS9]|nr:hypothetical protein J23TS9_34280 [Paenibacillus sp. J23TS9]